MRIGQRRLLVVVIAIALAASVLPFPGSTPVRVVVPQPADQALALPVAPLLPAEGY